MNIIQKMKNHIELIIGILLVIAGIVLLFTGFYSPVVGEIHNSVLVAYGEVSTFAGAILGVDYSYRFKIKKLQIEKQIEEDDSDD